MSENVLPGILAAVARKIRAEFDENSYIEHRGSKGSVREDSLVAVLRKYLPQHVLVTGSCEIIDSIGQRSGQCDIVIHDAKAPPIFGATGFQILPIECVYAVIEVKSNLTWAELEKSCRNLARIKRMPKVAYHANQQVLAPQRQQYGQTYPHCPTTGFIFGYDSSDLWGMSDNLIGLCREMPVAERLDGAWVLGKGSYNWLQAEPSDSFVPFAEPRARLAILDSDPEQDVILNMVIILNTVMSLVFMPPFDLIQYAASAELGRNGRSRAFE